MLGVVDKFVSNIASKCPPVDIQSDLFKIVYHWAFVNKKVL
jgi:hypothetical protein